MGKDGDCSLSRCAAAYESQRQNTVHTQSNLGMQIKRLFALIAVIHGPGWRLNRPAGCYAALRRCREACLPDMWCFDSNFTPARNSVMRTRTDREHG